MVTAMITGHLILTLYSFMLSTILAIGIIKPPVNHLEELMNTSILVFVWDGTEETSLFRHAPKDNIFRKTYVETYYEQDRYNQQGQLALKHGNLLFARGPASTYTSLGTSHHLHIKDLICPICCIGSG